MKPSTPNASSRSFISFTSFTSFTSSTSQFFYHRNRDRIEKRIRRLRVKTVVVSKN